jgi:hypothetical protein
VTFISIHSVIIYVVFFGACMRCSSLKSGVTVEGGSANGKDPATERGGRGARAKRHELIRRGEADATNDDVRGEGLLRTAQQRACAGHARRGSSEHWLCGRLE